MPANSRNAALSEAERTKACLDAMYRRLATFSMLGVAYPPVPEDAVQIGGFDFPPQAAKWLLEAAKQRTFPVPGGQLSLATLAELRSASNIEDFRQAFRGFAAEHYIDWTDKPDKALLDALAHAESHRPRNPSRSDRESAGAQRASLIVLLIIDVLNQSNVDSLVRLREVLGRQPLPTGDDPHALVAVGGALRSHLSHVAFAPALYQGERNETQRNTLRRAEIEGANLLAAMALISTLDDDWLCINRSALIEAAQLIVSVLGIHPLDCWTNKEAAARIEASLELLERMPTLSRPIHDEAPEPVQAPPAGSLLFVYGTLQRGMSNHVQMEDAEFIGSAHTADRAALYLIDGLPMLDPNSDTTPEGKVFGEVYRVGPALLEQLDSFECVPALYERESIRVQFTSGDRCGEWLAADAYLVPLDRIETLAEHRDQLIRSGRYREEDASPEGEAGAQPGSIAAHRVRQAPSRLDRTRLLLQRGVFGQEQAIHGLARICLTAALRGADKGPELVLHFAGPEGAGQKAVIGNLKTLWKNRPVFCVDGANYESANSGFALVGMQHGYSDAHPGELTDFVRQHPNALIVIERYEQAHPNIQAIFGTLLHDGELLDQYGFYEKNDRAKGKMIAEPRVDFGRTAVILTTRLGDVVYQDLRFMAAHATSPRLIEGAYRTAIEKAKTPQGDPAVHPSLTSALRAYPILPFRLLGMADLERATLHALTTLCASARERGTRIELRNKSDIARALVLSEGDAGTPDKVAQAARTLLSDVIALQPGAKTAALTVRIPANDRRALSDIVAELGEDPLRTLKRRRRAVGWQLCSSLGRETNAVAIALRGFVLNKLPDVQDFGGRAGVCIDVPDVRFDDISGQSKIKEVLKEIVAHYKNPKDLHALGAALPTGAVLYGQPGTGKTTIAKAIAGESGLPFLSVSGPDLLNSAMIQEVFRIARTYAPAVLFIDEIDVLGVRGDGGYERAINQLLTEIDGFSKRIDEAVFVVAATNQPNRIDPALIRPGRLELKLHVGALDRDGRQHFLRRIVPLIVPETLNESRLLDASAALTGAEMEKVLRETAMLVLRRGEPAVPCEDVVELFESARHGSRRDDEASAGHRERTVWHEAGHAVVARALLPAMPVREVSSVGRGSSAGRTEFDRWSDYSAHGMRAYMAVLVAGRAAEVLRFGDAGINAGAEDDLARTTAAAMSAVCEYGMDAQVGPVHIQTMKKLGLPGGMDTMIAERIREWIDEAQRLAAKTLEANQPALAALAEALLREGELRGTALEQLLGPVQSATAPTELRRAA